MAVRRRTVVMVGVLVGTVAAGAGVGLGLGAAGAQTATTAAVGPPGLLPVSAGPNGYFEFTVAAGTHQDFSVIVKNLSNAAATYPLYAAAASTAGAGGVAYAQRDPAPAGTAAWLQIPTPTVTIAANQNVTVGLGVTVPATAGAGDYVTAVAADSPATATSGASTGSGANVQLTTTSRVVVAVVIHVPGPLHPSIAWNQPLIRLENGGRQILDVPFDDDGNQLLKPHLSGTVTPCAGGSPVVSIDRQLDTFVPRTTGIFSYPIAPAVLPAGCYRVALDGSFSGGPLGSFRGTLTVGAGAAAPPLATGGSGGTGRGAGRAATSSSSTLVLAGIAVLAVLLGGILVVLVLILRRRPRSSERA